VELAAAPGDAVAGEGEEPNRDLQNVFYQGHPKRAEVGAAGQFSLAIECFEHPDNETKGAEAEAAGGRSTPGPKQRPKGGVAEFAQEIGDGLRDADGSSPALLVVPDILPRFCCGAAFDDDRRNHDLSTCAGDLVSKLVIVGEVVGQRLKPADCFEGSSFHGHDCAHCEIEAPQRACLEDLAPKIGVDGEGFPAHAKVAHVGEAIKAIDQPDRLVAERLDDLSKKI